MRRFASLFGRRGVLAAAGVAGGVLAMVVVQELLGSIASTALASVNQVLPPLYFDTLWSGSIVFVVLVQLPMAVGVFFCLWLIAPIAAELRLAHVITRAILASGVGATLTTVVTAVREATGMFSRVGSLFSNSFPALPVDGILQAVLQGLQHGIFALLHIAPLVILAGILLWLWLHKHPSRHAVSGMLDEV